MGQFIDVMCARAYGQSIFSLNMAVQNINAQVRDSFIEEECSVKKFFTLALSEAVFLINIPIAIIEILARAALALLILPFRCCLSKKTLTQIDNIAWVGAVISTTYAINNLLALIRGLDCTQKINVGTQMRIHLDPLYRLTTWAMSSPREFATDPRISH